MLWIRRPDWSLVRRRRPDLRVGDRHHVVFRDAGIPCMGRPGLVGGKVGPAHACVLGSERDAATVIVRNYSGE